MGFMRHRMRIVLRIGEVAMSVAVFLSCAGLLSCGTTKGQNPTTQAPFEQSSPDTGTVSEELTVSSESTTDPVPDQTKADGFAFTRECDIVLDRCELAEGSPEAGKITGKLVAREKGVVLISSLHFELCRLEGEEEISIGSINLEALVESPMPDADAYASTKIAFSVREGTGGSLDTLPAGRYRLKYLYPTPDEEMVFADFTVSAAS
ncbi:MAG: hypothetical protein ACI4WV_00515 [Eubacteriales bacterium]